MRHTIFTTALLLSVAQLTYGQDTPSAYADATYQYSENTLNGTARFRGLGGRRDGQEKGKGKDRTEHDGGFGAQS